MRQSILAASLLLAGCGGSVATAAGSRAFVGTWECGNGQDAATTSALVATLTITANGNHLTETIAVDTPNGPLSCTLTFTASGSTANLDVGQMCIGMNVVTASSVTEVVNGNTMTVTETFSGSGPGSGTSGGLCTRQ